eukprot:TRINITY_DN40080_c0_g1_i1.p1 TRINITY_DN40080_c0_g1~~TRINITY_DN40080_c0_g1_i1.p1  ORF type:complete len:355 (+),score=107.17 TRINITY_DN40080_c0_g1_i1:98-1162(+)
MARKSKGGQEQDEDDGGDLNGKNGNGQHDTPSKVKKRVSGKQTLEDGADNGNSTTRSKKARTSKGGDGEETVADEAADAVYLKPVDEAADAVDAPVAQRAASFADSDPEDGVTDPMRNGGSWGSIVRDDTDADHDFAAWRRAIEDLRRQRKPEARRGELGHRPTVEELLRSTKQALQGGDWALLGAPQQLPKPSDVAAVARQLSREEVVPTLKALADRHESHPRERMACSLWIVQILDQRGETLLGRRDLVAALRPLLRSLSRRIGPASAAGNVLSCIGKWKMAAGLAKSRRQEQARAAAGTNSSNTVVADDSEGDDYGEDDEEEDEDDDADEVVPGKNTKAAPEDSDDDDDDE